ncbi:MAG TPA: response regulator [bacterium]
MKRKQILIIDGDDAFSSGVLKILDESGYDVLSVQTGEEGLKLAKRIKPDLVLLSVELDDMSGYVVCKKIKENEELKSIPLIITSDNTAEGGFEKHKKLKVRAEDYIRKPFTDDFLLQKINNFLGFHVTEEEFSQMQEQVLAVMQEKVELEKKVSDQEDMIEKLNELSITTEVKIKKLQEENRILLSKVNSFKEKYSKIKEDIINYLKETD